MKSRLSAIAIALAMGLVVAGCSAPADEPQPEAVEAAPDDERVGLPDCDAVWQEGATLDADYRGCEEDGSGWSRAGVECTADERRALENYDAFWAWRGESIQRFEAGFEDDPDGDAAFQAAFAECFDSD